MERIFSTMVPTGPGRLSKATIRNRDEFNVFSFVVSFVKGGSLFSDDKLFEDFCRALKMQGLLQPQEKKVLRDRKSIITLFALRAMHNRGVELEDKSIAKLAIAPDMKKRLAIFAFTEVTKRLDGTTTNVAVWVFQTNLPISDYCEPGVAAAVRHAFVGDFEVSEAGKLRRVA